MHRFILIVCVVDFSVPCKFVIKFQVLAFSILGNSLIRDYGFRPAFSSTCGFSSAIFSL
jgi:hypothetical protein